MKMDKKKILALTALEFSLFKRVVQLENNLTLENESILLNIQVSGGRDSQCLLLAFSRIMSSNICNFKNKYQLIAQHFNHKQRADESEEDMYFVGNYALKIGVPFYVNTLQESQKKQNQQEYFRSWRKKEGLLLSAQLASELKCSKFFIVTAHHARDHVETVLQHILRGTGLAGLKGISLLDESGIFLRPFHDVSYEDLIAYATELNVAYREDSSNQTDKYHRNYIRHHILPHFEVLQKNYQESFVKLSRHVSLTENNQPISQIIVKKDTTISELFKAIVHLYSFKNMSENTIENILHGSRLLLNKKEVDIQKNIPIKNGRIANLVKFENQITLTIDDSKIKSSE